MGYLASVKLNSAYKQNQIKNGVPYVNIGLLSSLEGSMAGADGEDTFMNNSANTDVARLSNNNF